MITDEILLKPDWENARRMDWRNYVGARTKAMWEELPLHVRRAIAEDAEEACDSDPRWDE